MRVQTGRNVNNLFISGMGLLNRDGVPQDSRAGRVLVMPCPVMSVYEQPMERVLFDGARDANPFFHLMESLWMLAGRDDAAFLDKYIRDFGSRYADSGVIHGAYGRRWRSALGFDQLDHVVERLRRDPTDRQCVIQMWDGVETFKHGDKNLGFNDLLGNWKDRPCNTHLYLRVRNEIDRLVGDVGYSEGVRSVLDLTICCRSNDAVWGAHGANAVHFSVLQEYLAGRIGVGVGTMYQFSNNYHIYESAVEKMSERISESDGREPYLLGEVAAMPIGLHWESWDEDLETFMQWHDNDLGNYRGDQLIGVLRARVSNEWFASVAGRVALARWDWTHGFKHTARASAEQIEATDWRRACLEWMDRRGECGDKK